MDLQSYGQSCRMISNKNVKSTTRCGGQRKGQSAMSIRLDDRYAQNFAQPGELAAMAAEVQAAQEKLHSATGAGSDFWVG